MAINVCTALLLEDEPLVAIDLDMTLTAAGFTVYTAMSCIEANSWLESNRPDIVVVDIELRDGTCAGVVTRLNEANILSSSTRAILLRFISVHRSLMDARGWGSPQLPKGYFRPLGPGSSVGQAISDQVRILIQPG